MAPTRGFQQVFNGNINGAGIVLPNSQAADFAINQILKDGLLRQKEAKAATDGTAQLNKDYATNQLKLPPTIQYRSEVSNLAQKWFDKGVQFRRQGFNPFTPDYTKPDQVAASQQYLSEKKKIEDLADLAKAVDTHYTANLKESQAGKLDGFDEYQAKLQNTKLNDLYEAGGINALPQLYKPFDTSAVDKEVDLKPQTRQIDEEVGGGIVNKVTEKFVNIPQAARTAETAILNQPGVNQYLKKKGVQSVDKLYTRGGHNMIIDKENPEDFGHIDEPGIYHQLATDYLTNPDLIKELPKEVKENILKNSRPSATSDAKKFGMELLAKPYTPTEDPAFKKFIDKKFDDQIKQERAYQGEIADAIGRKLPSMDLGSTSKMDATLANLNLRKETNNQGWQRLDLAKQNAALAREKWGSRLKTESTRNKWIGGIESLNPEAVAQFGEAVKEIRGNLKTVNGGIVVTIPETVQNFTTDRATGKQTNVVDPINPKRVINRVYRIDKYKSSRAQRTLLEQIINKLPTFGKEKALTTEPYNPTYNDIGGTDSADDL